MRLKLSSVKWWPFCPGVKNMMFNLLATAILNSYPGQISWVFPVKLSSLKCHNISSGNGSVLSSHCWHISLSPYGGTSSQLVNVWHTTIWLHWPPFWVLHFQNAFSWIEVIVFWLNSWCNLYLMSDYQSFSIVSSNGLEPKRREAMILQRRLNERADDSNHRRYDGLLNRLFRCRSKKTSMLRVTGLCEENSSVTGEFASQRINNAENVSIWWRHYDYKQLSPKSVTKAYAC